MLGQRVLSGVVQVTGHRRGHRSSLRKRAYIAGKRIRTDYKYYLRYPYSSRKKKLQEQNYRCRGCGSYVTLEYSKTFRFCVYTGQYYCTACHRNQLSVIPAYVLDDWNFKLYPVSVVAYRLLDDIWFSPLFNISSINPQLFSRAPVLQARKLRGALQLARKHVLACRSV